jgi:4-azaleucine resistance transporter AzlC
MKQSISRAFKCAFPHTIPILAGFMFLGLSHGILMNVSGFRFWYPLITSIVVFGGSLEFVLVSILLSPYAPLQTFFIALMIHTRHLFYGISMLDKFKGMGWKKPYLIFGMCDETFSINCTAQIPDDVDRGWFYFFVTLLDQLYWVCGSTLGGIIGNLLPFNTEGIDFVMTAMFVVIFLEQWLKDKQHSCQWIGLASSVVCLLIFGQDSFLIPTMLCILSGLTIFRKSIENDNAQGSPKEVAI